MDADGRVPHDATADDAVNADDATGPNAVDAKAPVACANAPSSDGHAPVPNGYQQHGYQQYGDAGARHGGQQKGGQQHGDQQHARPWHDNDDAIAVHTPAGAMAPALSAWHPLDDELYAGVTSMTEILS